VKRDQSDLILGIILVCVIATVMWWVFA